MKKKIKKGKVVLVGAGPGDEKLITLKGVEALQKADTVFYDRLINKEILKHASPRAKLFYCGKKSGSKDNLQDEISYMLLSEAEKGNNVVRLKGGDPFLFGRGAEEAQFLSERDISVEIIPGVPSAIAVPESAGIPVTCRKYSSTLVITAGKLANGKTASLGKEAKILKKKGTTLVVLMGVRGLKIITSSLIKNGVPKNTPALLIQDGTLINQRIAEGNIENIAALSKKMNITAPAVFVAGSVARMRNKIFPYVKPLSGKRILVTRSEKRNGKLSSLIRGSGGSAINIPLIKIKERNIKGRRQKIRDDIKKSDWLIFTSVTGAEIFKKKIIARSTKTPRLNARICAIGEATGEYLQKKGFKVDFIPGEYSSKGILEGLKRKEISGKRIILFRSSIGLPLLPETLKSLGAKVKEYPLYDIVTAYENRKILNEQIRKNMDIITFTSSSAVRSFVKLAGKRQMVNIVKNTLFAVIGDVTEKELEKFDLKANIKPEKFTIPDMAMAIKDYYFRKE